ncbi:hypothetical protein C834K_0421 [Chlamydia poikilotherma]|uniref:Uncharacterized protein n=1 Tax=Chlamydia poikilotherma TaxID=1967783 RepID=A0A3B0PPA4_9CHLA|nr:hypothetical protein [Chlamydia poikilotherma]SYX08880.1 hypothetical protein C834K_0421 [Chlamydia poikilotherma]
MTSSVPSLPNPEFTSETSVSTSTDFVNLDKSVLDIKKKIQRSNIISIVVMAAAALLSAIGIVCAIVTGITALWALTAGAILCAIVLLIVLHQYRSHLRETKLSELSTPKEVDIEKTKTSLDGNPTSSDESKGPVDESNKTESSSNQTSNEDKKSGPTDGNNQNVENSGNVNENVDQSSSKTED